MVGVSGGCGSWKEGDGGGDLRDLRCGPSVFTPPCSPVPGLPQVKPLHSHSRYLAPQPVSPSHDLECLMPACLPCLLMCSASCLSPHLSLHPPGLPGSLASNCSLSPLSACAPGCNQSILSILAVCISMEMHVQGISRPILTVMEHASWSTWSSGFLSAVSSLTTSPGGLLHGPGAYCIDSSLIQPTRLSSLALPCYCPL